MTWKKLNNPPIKEAIFDLRFLSDTKISIESIKSFSNKIKNEFKNVLPLYLLKIEGSTSVRSSQISQDRKKIGYKLANENKNFILQLTQEGFTFNKLPLYNTWEEVEENAFKYLTLFLEEFPNIHFQRIALRYINEFDLEIKLGELIENSLLILPIYPANLPHSLENYYIQLTIPENQKEFRCIINFAMQPYPGEKEKFKILLDIDVQKNKLYSKDSIEELKVEFQHLREFKNMVFFQSLTPKVIDKFN